MKFGKVLDLQGIDFHLPADHKSNSRRTELQQSSSGVASEVLIGATGWSMKAWSGKWYAPKSKSTDYLRQYGKLFNTIELNTTHYRVPSQEQVRKWVDQVPADFRFCPKLPQRISHANDLAIGSDLISNVVRSMDAFDEKMGCCFMQLPPYFGHDRLVVLERFLGSWPSLIPLAIEVRHGSWFTHTQHTTDWLDLLAKHGVTAVITDVAGRRDVLHMGLTTARTMIRFVGNGLVDSDYERLNYWAERLQQWQPPEVYFFPHQPDNLLSPEAAAYFSHRLKSHTSLKTRGPVQYQEPPEEQLSLF